MKVRELYAAASLRIGAAWKRPEVKFALLIPLISRVVLGIVGIASIAVVPIGTISPARAAALNFSELTPRSSWLWPYVNPFQRWDALWYQGIAEHGYRTAHETVFSPLYPLLGHIVESVLPISISLLLLSSVCYGVSCYLLYRFALHLTDAADARRTLFLFAAFPSAFYFSSGYPESLAFATTIATLFLLVNKRFLPASATMCCAVLSRPVCIVLVVPFLVELGASYFHTSGSSRVRGASKLLLAAVPLAVYESSWLYFGSRFHIYSSIQAESLWQAHIVSPLTSLKIGFTDLLHGIDPDQMLLNGFAAVASAVLCIPLWRKFPPSLFLYSAAMSVILLVQTYSSTPFLGDIRYILLCIPLFPLLGVLLRRPLIFYSTIAIFAFIQFMLFVGFVHFQYFS